MVEDKPKAEFYSFTQKDVIFYPDNENPGKSYYQPPLPNNLLHIQKGFLYK